MKDYHIYFTKVDSTAYSTTSRYLCKYKWPLNNQNIRRQEQKLQIINELKQRVTSGHLIEYSYFGFTDKYCYDLRREVRVTSKQLLCIVRFSI